MLLSPDVIWMKLTWSDCPWSAFIRELCHWLETKMIKYILICGQSVWPQTVAAFFIFHSTPFNFLALGGEREKVLFPCRLLCMRCNWSCWGGAVIMWYCWCDESSGGSCSRYQSWKRSFAKISQSYRKAPITELQTSTKLNTVSRCEIGTLMQRW